MLSPASRISIYFSLESPYAAVKILSDIQPQVAHAIVHHGIFNSHDTSTPIYCQEMETLALIGKFQAICR
jgi:hypothetical protein